VKDRKRKEKKRGRAAPFVCHWEEQVPYGSGRSQMQTTTVPKRSTLTLCGEMKTGLIITGGGKIL